MEQTKCCFPIFSTGILNKLPLSSSRVGLFVDCMVTYKDGSIWFEIGLLYYSQVESNKTLRSSFPAKLLHKSTCALPHPEFQPYPSFCLPSHNLATWQTDYPKHASPWFDATMLRCVGLEEMQKSNEVQVSSQGSGEWVPSSWTHLDRDKQVLRK